jgi:hypothetical protein
MDTRHTTSETERLGIMRLCAYCRKPISAMRRSGSVYCSRWCSTNAWLSRKEEQERLSQVVGHSKAECGTRSRGNPQRSGGA